MSRSSVRPADDHLIQVASSWILRIGVAASVSTMLLGLSVSLAVSRPTIEQMEEQRLIGSLHSVVAQSLRGSGPALMELGIILLVLTPITRVAGSMVLFAVGEKDYLYAAITLAVLTMTLISFLALG